MADEFHISFKADLAETTPLDAPLCLHYGESKFSLHAGSPSCLRSTFCAATPLLKFKTLVSCVRFFTGFLCVVHLLGLRRGGGRWWWQPISFPYTSVSLFSQGVFGAILSGPSLCSHSSRFATLGRGGSGDFRGVLPLPVVPWVPFSL